MIRDEESWYRSWIHQLQNSENNGMYGWFIRAMLYISPTGRKARRLTDTASMILVRDSCFLYFNVKRSVIQIRKISSISPFLELNLPNPIEVKDFKSVFHFPNRLPLHYMLEHVFSVRVAFAQKPMTFWKLTQTFNEGVFRRRMHQHNTEVISVSFSSLFIIF